ncbi:alpha/beta hydrolase [Sphingomonas pokkalii]|uniref:Esterase n=1 Tax=Sphingomonas pokkalii TaxID=2175090 RepID=A0A2U0SHJ6_9SPHN|nr:alpha/beta hydrolase [Sphingomonas pokkalii]PVX30794.1 esterase [Sphingomonas pokkalii]
MRVIGWVVAGLFLAGPPALARQQVETAAAPVAAASKRDLAYGALPAQKLDFYLPTRATHAPPPLVVFVHGGGWRMGNKENATGTPKIAHLRDAGYAFATIDYRLIPEAPVERQAEDVAAALGWLIAHARELGFDPNHVVLMGHSAGAHLSALVGTDPQYLEKQGLAPERLRGVILLDGAAYDVPAQLAEAGRFMQPIYDQAFGSDPARQRRLSPITHAAAPNAPSFLILHVDRADGTRQSEALAAALRAAGSKVVVQGIEGRGLRGHVAMNRQLGAADYPATAIVDRWLSATFSPR